MAVELIRPGADQEDKNPGGTAAVKEESGTSEDYIEATTAFIIFIRDDGTVIMTPNLSTPIVSARQPSINEVYSSCGIVMKDIRNQESAAMAAQFVVNRQMQMAAEMRDAQLSQQALKGLKLT